MVPIKAGRLIARNLYSISKISSRLNQCVYDVILMANWRYVESMEMEISYRWAHGAVFAILLAGITYLCVLHLHRMIRRYRLRLRQIIMQMDDQRIAWMHT